MSLYKRNGIWWLDTTINGERHRVSTNTVSKSEANLFEKEYRKGVIGGKVLPNKSIKVGLTLEDALDRAYRTSWKDNKALRSYITIGKQLEELIGGKVLLKEISSKTVAKLKDDLIKQKIAPATVNRKLATLSSLMNIARREWEEIDSIPNFQRLPERNARTRVLTPDEEAEAITWFQSNEPAMADLVTVLVDTGIRLGEAINMRPEHVDFERNFVRIFKTKNNRPRSVPLTNRVMQILKQRRESESTIFPEYPTTFAAIYRWTKMSEAIGKQDDKEYVLHALRHTCATRLLEAGVDVYTVKEWLGHEVIETTLRYAKMTNLKLNDALNKLQGVRR